MGIETAEGELTHQLDLSLTPFTHLTHSLTNSLYSIDSRSPITELNYSTHSFQLTLIYSLSSLLTQLSYSTHSLHLLTSLVHFTHSFKVIRPLLETIRGSLSPNERARSLICGSFPLSATGETEFNACCSALGLQVETLELDDGGLVPEGYWLRRLTRVLS